MALVSIIMPVYNCAMFISEAVDSVLGQTIKDWELEIVDDCSTDNTYEVLCPYLDRHPNIHYSCLEKNSGPAAARTEAIRRASGRYIAFIDSDDIWHPQKLEKQIKFMQENGTNFSCTAYSQIDENGGPLGYICYPPEKTDYKKMLRLSNPIGNTTVIYDQQELGKYEVPPIKKRNDFALWLKILKDTRECAGIQEILAYYRIRPNSVSSNKLGQAKYHWQLYHDIEQLGFIRSSFYLLCWAFVKGTGIGLNRKKVIQRK